MSVSLAERIDALLPQTQCTRCGFPNCRAYANAIADDDIPINRCPPGGADTIARLAEATDGPPLPLDPSFGDEETQGLTAYVREAECIGCYKCIRVCPVDAIVGTRKLMHTVIKAECTGCELCIPACPVDCIDLRPNSTHPLPARNRAEHSRQRYRSRRLRLLRTTAEQAEQRRRESEANARNKRITDYLAAARALNSKARS